MQLCSRRSSDGAHVGIRERRLPHSYRNKSPRSKPNPVRRWLYPTRTKVNRRSERKWLFASTGTSVLERGGMRPCLGNIDVCHVSLIIPEMVKILCEMEGCLTACLFAKSCEMKLSAGFAIRFLVSVPLRRPSYNSCNGRRIAGCEALTE